MASQEEWSLRRLALLMREAHSLREECFASLLRGGRAEARIATGLVRVRDMLLQAPRQDGMYVFHEQGQIVRRSLRYELSELEKDIAFLTLGEGGLLARLRALHEGFDEQVKDVARLLERSECALLLTDRDGTINNYAEQHLLSGQSLYNAHFLAATIKRFEQAVIITSAPLRDTQAVSLLRPAGNLVLAASKGREYVSEDEEHRMPLEEEDEEAARALRGSLEALLSEDPYRVFALIGSGFQVKHGQLTLARQDVSGSISEERSQDLLHQVTSLVREADPEGKRFTIEDTGLDVEIMLCAAHGETFDKGTGVRFLREELGLPVKGVVCCGDTASDLPLLRENPGCAAIFVTTDPGLREQVSALCPDAVFVTTPDALVTGLYRGSTGGGPAGV